MREALRLAQASHEAAMSAHEETKATLQVRVRVRVWVRVGGSTRQDSTTKRPQKK